MESGLEQVSYYLQEGAIRNVVPPGSTYTDQDQGRSSHLQQELPGQTGTNDVEGVNQKFDESSDNETF